MFTIKQRDVPEQLVLTEQRSVRADELSDFLVEVCVPIASVPGDGVATRTEPAHREAYTRIRKEQVVFPN